MSHINEHSLEMAIVELFELHGYTGDTAHKPPPDNNLSINNLKKKPRN